ncbi:oligopeptide transporter, OPT family [bacterium]|nr:oligopeptide transporter, OPT family [candidate division CSSED10-310 bacterium]
MNRNDPAEPELTLLALILGSVLAVIMCAANAYLGLYAGMTVSASIPAAVISAGIIGGILKRRNILESNIVQTMASAGESLAAGIIFTVPALVIVGIWNDFNFWQTTLIAVAGGLIGVLFMIPLRRSLIVESADLRYPEGVACAEVLKSSEYGGTGLRTILGGILAGGIFKLFTTGIPILRPVIEAAARTGNRLFFFGMDASPALIAVGYIIRLNIASLVFLGGFIGWVVVLPFLDIPAGIEYPGSPAQICWELWSSRIRYLGVGAMIVGGLWSILSVRSGIKQSIRMVLRGKSRSGAASSSGDEDLTGRFIRLVFLVAVLITAGLYFSFTGSTVLTLLTTGIMIVAAFFFVAVSSYIVGLVGSSNNPVSGMTICALLGTGILLFMLGIRGDNAIYATLGVAGVVCCAACSAGDISQDLKTGYLVGAKPKHQQFAQILAVIIPTVTIAPVLSLLHNAYGIGIGLKAPQASLFASITQGMFGDGTLPYDMIGAGIVLGISIIGLDMLLSRRKSRFRLHIMPVAVGIYLPLSLSVPIFIGGLLSLDRSGVERVSPSADTGNGGILVSSGLIAGEAIMGIVLAVFIYFDWILKVTPAESGFTRILQISATTLAMAGICLLIRFAGTRPDRSGRETPE